MLSVENIENLKILKYHIFFFIKTLVISVICRKCGSKHKKYSKKDHPLKY